VKVVVLVLVVAAGLLVAFVVMGIGKPNGGVDVADGRFVGDLRDLLIGPADEVLPAELSGDCVSGSHLAVAGACIVQVAPSDSPVRELSLESVAGSAKVSLSQPDQIDVPARTIPEEDDPKASFSVFNAGGTLVIVCTSGPSCGLRVTPEGA